MQKEEELVAVAFRIPKSLRDQIERFRGTMKKERPGSTPSFSQAVRVLIVLGIEGSK